MVDKLRINVGNDPTRIFKERNTISQKLKQKRKDNPCHTLSGRNNQDQISQIRPNHRPIHGESNYMPQFKNNIKTQQMNPFILPCGSQQRAENDPMSFNLN